ncbi:MAG TPA: amidohydrolase family protein, partial [Alphaproteobacteria bacterium]|nr:amidohydrolase family protein [Alphaproteobacteria bacterium]
RGGTIVDGSGLPGYRADLGVIGGKIAEIGDLSGRSAEEVIDAEGHVVAPGFIDGHAHYDAQIFWDEIGSNICWHGVTTAVMGNCGFTLAPCPEDKKEQVFTNLEMAEEIPPDAMEAGIPWSWETFPEFLDTVDGLPKGLNYASYVGHSAIRTYVMGERAYQETADEDDLAALRREVEIAMKAGAIGFSTTCSSNHRTAEGGPVASRFADWSEIRALVDTMADLGSGVFELSRGIVNVDPEERAAEIERLKTLAIETRVPCTFGGAWSNRSNPNSWRPQFAMVDDVTANGGHMLVQATASWNGSLRSFETFMPYDNAPVWKEFRKLPLEEQEKGLRDPEMRAKLVGVARNHKRETDPSLNNVLLRDVDWDWIFPVYNTLPPFRSVAEIAAERDQDPIETMIDLALERHLKLFFLAPTNCEDQDYVLAMLRHPNTAVTFGDSGAHIATIVNPVQADLLGNWVRQRQAITLEAAVRKITFDIAAFWGLAKRGLLREGWHADICVFDPETIAPDLPELVHDLPTGAARILQKAIGIKETIVNGEVLMRGTQHTGALPGRLLRGSLAAA